jgi:hypothetical protein
VQHPIWLLPTFLLFSSKLKPFIAPEISEAKGVTLHLRAAVTKPRGQLIPCSPHVGMRLNRFLLLNHFLFLRWHQVVF